MKLRDLRGSKTLEEVSKQTGLDRGTLSRIERGEQFPRKETAVSLAEFYDVSVGAIFDAIPNAKPAMNCEVRK